MHNMSYAEVLKNSTVLQFTLIFPSIVALRIYVVYITSICQKIIRGTYPIQVHIFHCILRT